jgi:YD repeat-containing protein
MAVIEAWEVWGQQRSTFTDYDAAGNVATVMHPIDYDLDAQGQAVIDPRRVVTSYGYDAMNRVTEVTEADNVAALRRTTTQIYDKAGLLIGTQSPAGLVVPVLTTSFVYNAAGRLLDTIEGSGNPLVRSTVRYYDGAGNRYQVIDALGRITRYAYDRVNRLVAVIEADNIPELRRTTDTVYDLAGNVRLEIDARGVMTSYHYDRRHRAVTTVEALGVWGQQRTTRTAYDPAGNVLSVTRPEGYDLRPNGVKVAHPANVTTSYAYDALSRQTAVIEAYRVNGQPSSLQRTTLTGYDEAGNVLSVISPRAYDNQFGPDTPNPRTVTTSYAYDALGRLTQTIEAYNDPDGLQRTTRTEYDAADNVVKVSTPRKFDNQAETPSDPRSVSTVYRYDELGRQVKVIEGFGLGGPTAQEPNRPWLQRTTKYDYDKADNLVAETHPQGYDAVDAQGNLIEEPVNPVVTQHDYDLLGRRVRTVEAANVSGLERTTLFRYNAGDELVSESHARVYGVLTDPVTELPPNTVTTSYGYDALGRRTHVIEAFGSTGANGLQHTTRTYYDAADHVQYVVEPRFYDGQTPFGPYLEPAVTTSYAYRSFAATKMGWKPAFSFRMMGGVVRPPSPGGERRGRYYTRSSLPSQASPPDSRRPVLLRSRHLSRTPALQPPTRTRRLPRTTQHPPEGLQRLCPTGRRTDQAACPYARRASRRRLPPFAQAYPHGRRSPPTRPATRPAPRNRVCLLVPGNLRHLSTPACRRPTPSEEGLPPLSGSIHLPVASGLGADPRQAANVVSLDPAGLCQRP